MSAARPIMTSASTKELDQRRLRLLGMTALHKTVERIAAGILGILRMITVPRAWVKEVAMAKVIEFHIPKNLRKSFKWIPELQREKFAKFAHKQRSPRNLPVLENCHEFD